MSNFLVSVQAEALLDRIGQYPGRLQQALTTVLQRLSIQVQAAVKQKLSGQVLHVRTGTLRRSINRVVTSTPDSVVATVGTNVRYAAIHEFGFDGTVTVRWHVRKIASQSIGKGKKQTLQGVAFVKEHTRTVHMPERSFLRSTLREFGPQITRDVRAAALSAVTFGEVK